jgi:hypothetical protein
MSAALLLTACGLVIVGSWFVVFGVRGTSLHHWLPPVGLSVLGVCMDGFLFVVGPFADTGWWDSARFDESDQMLLAAALASATAFIGLAVAGLSSRQRLAKTQRH